jgi:hypothetical protein
MPFDSETGENTEIDKNRTIIIYLSKVMYDIYFVDVTVSDVRHISILLNLVRTQQKDQPIETIHYKQNSHGSRFNRLNK